MSDPRGKVYPYMIPWFGYPLFTICKYSTVKILKFGTPQTIAIIVLEIEKFDVTLH